MNCRMIYIAFLYCRLKVILKVSFFFFDHAECLGEIEKKLTSEDSSTRSLRRAFGFMDILNKDFIPILLCSKEEPTIFRATVK